MAEYAVTFQQRYRVDTHPVIAEVTDKSWLLVEVDDSLSYGDYRQALFDALERDFAFEYDYNVEFLQQIEDYELVQLPYKLRIDASGAHTLVKKKRTL